MVLTTLRKGITKLETAGYTASAFVSLRATGRVSSSR